MSRIIDKTVFKYAIQELRDSYYAVKDVALGMVPASDEDRAVAMRLIKPYNVLFATVIGEVERGTPDEVRG